MPNVSRPDLLPFARLDQIGLPFHGLVENGLLTLPDDSTVAYSQPLYWGETILVRHPRAQAVTRTAEEQADDTANNYQWLDYALLSGSRREIAGEQLGANHWLYCDANATWDVYAVIQKSGTTDMVVTVKLKRLFGWFGNRPDDYAMTERTLATFTWTVIDCNGVTISTARHAAGRFYTSSAKEDGSEILFNLYLVNSSGTGTWQRPVFKPVIGNLILHDVIRVSLSGNGSLVPGNIGAAISATVDHEARAPDFLISDSDETTDTANWDCNITFSDGAAQFTNGLTATTFYSQTVNTDGCKCLYVMLPDGTTEILEFQSVSTSTGEYSDSVSGAEPNGSYSITYTLTDSVVYTAAFGGATYQYTKQRTATKSDSGSYSTPGSICLTITWPDDYECTADGNGIDCEDYTGSGMSAYILSNNVGYVTTTSPKIIAPNGSSVAVPAGSWGSWDPGSGEIGWSELYDVCWV